MNGEIRNLQTKKKYLSKSSCLSFYCFCHLLLTCSCETHPNPGDSGGGFDTGADALDADSDEGSVVSDADGGADADYNITFDGDADTDVDSDADRDAEIDADDDGDIFSDSLLFRSDFEEGVDIVTRCDGASNNYYLVGSDQGFDWGLDLPGDSGESVIQTLVPCDYVLSDYSIAEITAVESYSGSRCLHLNTVHYASLPPHPSTTRTVLWPTAIETDDYDEFYMRWYMKIPSNVIDAFALEPQWLVLSTLYMGGESPTEEDFTPVNDLYISSNFMGEIFFKYHVGTGTDYIDRDISIDHGVFVPDDSEWHLYELYFKADVSDGVYLLRVDGDIALNWNGPTGNNVTTARIIGLYGDETVSEIYIDSFELWDSLPAIE